MRNRLIGIALGLVIAAALLAWQTHHRPATSWHVLPENQGAITAVALQYTHASGEFSKPAYEAFLHDADPATEIYALCSTQSDADEFSGLVRQWNLLNPNRVHTIVVGTPITGWCKDRFLVTDGAPATLLCPPTIVNGSRGRAGDSNIAPALAKAAPSRFRAVQTTLRFDSGDILTTPSRIIVSDLLWDKNNRDPHLESRLEAMFGRKVVWLHNVLPHHIGMFAAPLDDRTVLVGDPALMWPLWSPALDTELGRADFSPRVEQLFKNTQNQLRAAGFNVVRIPAAYLAPQVYVTYTNAVFETRNGAKIVYMPSYGVSTLDDAAASVYKAQGWQVKAIPVRTLYKLRGTIGCLINVVGRG